MLDDTRTVSQKVIHRVPSIGCTDTMITDLLHIQSCITLTGTQHIRYGVGYVPWVYTDTPNKDCKGCSKTYSNLDLNSCDACINSQIRRPLDVWYVLVL